MQQLCDLYEKNIEVLEDALEGEIVALQDKYQIYDDNNDLYVSLIMEAKKSSNEIINQAKDEVENILSAIKLNSLAKSFVERYLKKYVKLFMTC